MQVNVRQPNLEIYTMAAVSGTTAVFTMDAGRRGTLYALTALLVLDANVANRTLQFIILDESSRAIFGIQPDQVMTASQTWIHYYMPGMTQVERIGTLGTYNTMHIGIGPPFPLEEGYTINAELNNVQATDFIQLYPFIAFDVA